LPDITSRTIVHSTCPHDCPSTCALEVEKLDSHHIGRIRGASANSYTSGVVCEKVSRYAERVHHADRLSQPLKRTGAKGSGEFAPLSWESALDEVAEQFTRAAQRLGATSVWPLYYAGTMGLVQRDGIERLRHVMRYSRQHSTICTALVDAGWMAGVGAKMGPDPREMGDADLIIVWGSNPASTQVNVMTHIAKARRERNAQFIVVDPYRTPTAKVADTHLMLKPGTDGALARLARVKEATPFFDGARLDDIVDYLTYAFVPALLLVHAQLLTPGWGGIVSAAILLSSAYGFAATDAKTDDYFFTGFPSYWNVVALYLFAAKLPPVLNSVILLGLSVLVFVRIGYVYPSRTPILRGLTIALCLAWGLMLLQIIATLPDVSARLLIVSLFFPNA